MKSNEQPMNYTELMEKAMHQAHGVSTQEYQSDVDKMIEVEKKREQSYEQAKKSSSNMKNP